MKKEFCHLHVHSSYSMLDGLCSIPVMLAEAERLGIHALALTDHHNVSGAISFYLTAREWGVKPILGVELNVGSILGEPGLFHLTILSKNNQGYANLLQLITLSNLTNDGLVTRSMLESHKQGLIALSGCRESELDEWILQDYPMARSVALEYRNLFGQNNYYLELQRVGDPGEEERIAQKVQLARALNIPLVATNNVHYLHHEDAEVYQALHEIPRLTFEENHPPKMREEYYLKSPEEMAVLFNDLPEALENTVHIAERCNLFLDFEQRNVPRFPVPPGWTEKTYLEHLCREELMERHNLTLTREVRERLDDELGVISRMGYAGYFLVIWDLVAYAKTQGIMTSGRGSAAGSMVAYLLGITALNPLEYGLRFERFLHEGRAMLPELDLDLDHWGRKMVLQYLANKYGTENVAQVSTVNPLAALSVVRDVARVQGWPEEKRSLVLRFITHENIHEIDSLTNSMEFKEFYHQNSAFRKLIDTVEKLDGLPRHLTEHSTAVVVAQDPLTNYTALQYARDGEVITQFDLASIQALGLLKLNLLGVRFLSAMRATVELLQETRGVDLLWDTIPLDDLKTYYLLQRGDTGGCFELESDGARKMVRQVKPGSLQEIMFVLVLARLDGVDQGLVQNFLARIHGIESVEYFHPLLANTLDPTYGHILYQEQVMQIAEEVAGFGPRESDRLRQILSRKDRLAVAEQKSIFIKQAVVGGFTTAEANYLFDQLYKYAKQSFCKAHVATYARLAYLSAYLKAHYPVEYFASLLNVHLDIDYRFWKYLHQARYHHVHILPSDINRSKLFSTVTNGCIQLGLLQIKGLGRRAAEEIVKKREAEPYTSLVDFMKRVDRRVVCREMVEQLIKVGAFDAFGKRKDLLNLCEANSSGRRG